MHFWLLKSEPSEYSWQKMECDQAVPWDGVRNHQAQNYMKNMKVGDLAFFYHTGKEKAVVGIVEILKEYYSNSLVDVKYLRSLNNKVTLQNIKQNLFLKDMHILKQPRLSISPVSEIEWNEIIKMSKC
ncbi:MAG: EVE domain-containing protein [Wolbachia endosymbiont of Tyrophagus putrescentiae]|nr:EVE domain-containing protein [Wolbachia endosymbiont of Tyrophagus putrescentiae]